MTRKERSARQRKIWARRSKKERGRIGRKIVRNRVIRTWTREERECVSSEKLAWYGTEEGKRYRKQLSLIGKKRRHTEAAKEKISLSKLGDRNPAKRKDVRKKISKTAIENSEHGKSGRELRELRKKRREKQTLRELRKSNPTAYQEEVSRRISVGRKRAWKNPEVRERQVKAIQKAWDRDYEWRSVVSDETCRKLSKVMKGRDPVGRPRGPRTVWYVGKRGRVAMRSKDEVRYAKMLDKAKIKWLYEYCTFQVGRRTWTPDFFIPIWNKFVEVKGWLLSWVKRKIRKVIKHYASTCFEMIRSDRLVVQT